MIMASLDIFLKSWNRILEYYKPPLNSKSFGFIQSETYSSSRTWKIENQEMKEWARKWYSIWQWPEFSRAKNIICPLENRILIRITIAQFMAINFVANKGSCPKELSNMQLSLACRLLCRVLHGVLCRVLYRVLWFTAEYVQFLT